MGLVNLIAQHEGVSILFDVLSEKCPELAQAFDSIDTQSLREILCALAMRLIEEAEEDPKTKVINIHDVERQLASQALMRKYAKRLLSDEPVLPIILSFIKELGFSDVGGVDLEQLLINIAKHDEAKD